MAPPSLPPLSFTGSESALYFKLEDCSHAPIVPDIDCKSPAWLQFLKFGCFCEISKTRMMQSTECNSSTEDLAATPSNAATRSTKRKSRVEETEAMGTSSHLQDERALKHTVL
ncbi:UNVERIFIED_CONTAM: hypothetical protein FKN15_020230 [Acipenser sinensis]